MGQQLGLGYGLTLASFPYGGFLLLGSGNGNGNGIGNSLNSFSLSQASLFSSPVFRGLGSNFRHSVLPLIEQVRHTVWSRRYTWVARFMLAVSADKSWFAIRVDPFPSFTEVLRVHINLIYSIKNFRNVWPSNSVCVCIYIYMWMYCLQVGFVE